MFSSDALLFLLNTSGNFMESQDTVSSQYAWKNHSISSYPYFQFHKQKIVRNLIKNGPKFKEIIRAIKSVWITKTGVYLKPMVIQCTFAAIKSKKQPYFAAKYGRSEKFHEHKKAIIAIARMIYSLHLWHVSRRKNIYSYWLRKKYLS